MVGGYAVKFEGRHEHGAAKCIRWDGWVWMEPPLLLQGWLTGKARVDQVQAMYSTGGAAAPAYICAAP